MKKILILITTILLLVACVSERPPQTLDQKLSERIGKADRKETLRLACLNEAEWPLYNSYAYKHGNLKLRHVLKLRSNFEVSDMKHLCRQMDALTDSKTKENLSPKALTLSCETKVTAKKEIKRQGSAEHAARVERICKEMIGQKL